MSQNNNIEVPGAVCKPKRRLLSLAGFVPYGLGSSLLRFLLGNPLSQRLLLRGPRRQFLNLCRELGVSVDSAAQMTLHFMSRFTIPWRVRVLSHMNDAGFERWVHVENPELLVRLQGEGRAVLLVNSHTAIARLTPVAVQRLGLDLAVIEPEPYLQLMGARGADKIRSITLRGQGEKFWMKELYQAQKILLGKGIVHLALDGHQGSGGVEREFLGTQRRFHVSLAQLAMQIGADIVLVKTLLASDGAVSLRFVGPLDTGGTDLPPEARLDRFLTQYIPFLEDLWRQAPGNVSPRHLIHYMRARKAGPTAVAAAAEPA